ncbi:MAG: trypsin-like peptidase domain-containing protein [Patescibacteria group bacterium]
MDMNYLTKAQVVMLVILTSVVTAVATGIVAVSLISESPQPITETIHRVIERTGVSPAPAGESLPRTQESLVIKLVEGATPAVVSVVAAKDVPVVEQYYINPFEGDDFFGQFLPPDFLIPQYRQKGTARRQISAASGFFVSGDGFVVTNKHVVEDLGADYTVITNSGKRFPAKVLARDPVQDIAILKVEGAGFSYIPLGNSDTLKVGQTAVAIGNALGEFQNTVSVGVISGLSRTIIASGSTRGRERLSQVIQTDAAINPGNSGGPLLGLDGRAIGINTATAAGAENIGFALPINAVKKATQDVKATGRILYPYIGIRYVVINPAVKESQKLSVDYGALLRSSGGESALVAGSPAEKAGLKESDIILEIDGVRVSQDNTPGDLISRKRIGDTIKMKVLRGASELELKAILEERK